MRGHGQDLPARHPRREIRVEIQALRALAVAGVVVYHLFPRFVSGGYVGVDVFFVVSGFLIIGGLLAELRSQRNLDLARFWSRRVRRLVPASLAVLVATSVAVIALVPQLLWMPWFKQIAASAVYVQNWVLARDTVDYLRSDADPSPVQHFWSLSIEEQFYIVWPLAIVFLLLFLGKRSSATRMRAVGVLLALITVSSFAGSIVGVMVDPAGSYFFTTTRAWEFGVGGLLAYALARSADVTSVVRTVATWLGLGVIVGCILLYSPSTPFPGIAALPPVLATTAVIWGGSLQGTVSTSAMSLKPVQWLGAQSYSLYLWHWPLIVLLPFVIGREPGFVYKIGLLAAALVLAALTRRFIEDPVRRGDFWAKLSPRRTVAAGMVTVLLVVALSGWSYREAARAEEAARVAHDEAIAAATSCLGVQSLLTAGCDRPYAPNVLTDPAFAAGDIGKGVLPDDDCKQTLDDSRVLTCEVGDLDAPSAVIGLVGDSHAGQYLVALDQFGLDNGIQFRTYLKTWCAGTGADDVSAQEDGTSTAIASCASWGKSVIDELASSDEVSAVIFANFTTRYVSPATSGLGRPVQPQDFAAAWERLAKSGKRVIALRDEPNGDDVLIPGCVAQHIDEYDPCTTPLAAATLPEAKDPMLVAAHNDTGIRVVDLSDLICSHDVCHSVIGGLIVYFDSHHLSASFAKTLAAVLGERVVAALTP